MPETVVKEGSMISRWIVAGFIAGSVVSLSAQAAPDANLKFEVASVKAHKPGLAAEMRTIAGAHGSLTMRRQNLRDVIAWACDMRADAIKGPGWLDTEEYDIAAKAAEPTSQDQLKLMLQRLLVERFKLRFHHATEQSSIYALTLGKSGRSGLKIREVQKAASGGGPIGLNDGVFTREFVANMTQLAESLPMFLDRPVLNMTGLTGVYEFPLKVELEPQTRLPETGEMFTGFGMTSSIFAAMEDLGLKLVAQRGPVDTLVIDHIEHPTPN